MRQRVLFLCTGNSARSQMAEGLLRHYAGERFEALSAGTAPRSAVHPLAMRAMAEIGIDISAHRPKDLGEFLGQAFDCVITVCDRAQESCPNFPGQYKQLHWSFKDPAEAGGSQEEQYQVFRRVRDEILARLRLFITVQSRPS